MTPLKKYTVYFEIYGKRMKVKVQALTKELAEQTVREKLKIDNVIEDFDFANLFKKR